MFVSGRSSSFDEGRDFRLLEETLTVFQLKRLFTHVTLYTCIYVITNETDAHSIDVRDAVIKRHPGLPGITLNKITLIHAISKYYFT